MLGTSTSRPNCLLTIIDPEKLSTSGLMAVVGCPRRSLSKETDLAIGTVKWFNGQKGYGFIQPDDGGKDVFVHISALERAGIGTLNEGQRVKYDIARDRGKDAAANLSLA
jgi:cold shock protein